MRHIAQTLLAVLVVAVWFVALIWLVTSVSQIAIDRASTVHIPPGCSTNRVSECLP